MMNWNCLTSDGWKDVLNQRSYLVVTIHFLDNYQPMSICLEPGEIKESMTGASIYGRISDLLKEWEIPEENIVAMVTDGGANFVITARHFAINLHCAAHRLNLVIEDSMKGNVISALLNSVREIVKTFKQSNKMMNELREKRILTEQPDLKPIQDVCTRWNSTFLMINRYIDLQCEISLVLLKNGKREIDLDVQQLSHFSDVHSLFRPI